MADNVTLDPGAGGAVAATDDVGGVHYQRVKLVDGTLDSATAIASGGGVEAGALRVTIASDSTGVVSIDDNGANISIDDGGNSITVDNGGTFAVQADTELTTADLDTGAGTDTRAVVGLARAESGGGVLVGSANPLPVNQTAALPAGNNNIGDVDIASIAAGTTTIGDVGIKPRTTGGFSVHRRLGTADTNLATVKASAGQLFGWYIYNDGATEAYIKVYNKASNPVLASDTPVLTLPIPAGAAANVFSEIGIAFATGIALAATGAIGDTDTTALAADQVVINLLYA